MGVGNRVLCHVMDKGFKNQARGVKLGTEATEGASPAVQLAGIAVGAFAGSIYGGIQLINPMAIADSAFSDEDEMLENVKKAFDDAYGE